MLLGRGLVVARTSGGLPQTSQARGQAPGPWITRDETSRLLRLRSLAVHGTQALRDLQVIEKSVCKTAPVRVEK